MRKSTGRPWRLKPREVKDLVFSHNDPSTYNVVVDPDTLKIKAIIDWEYAGFYPPEFEFAFYKRTGPSVALGGEIDDTDVLMEAMRKDQV